MGEAAAETIIAAVRHRVLLLVAGNRLTYRALEPPPGHLLEAIRERRSDIIATLRAGGADSVDVDQNPRNEPTGVISSTSTASTGPWTPAELDLIQRAGAAPAALSAAAEVRQIFAGMGSRLMAVEPATGRGSRPRRRAARAIREARRRGDRDAAVALRDCWRERLAICLESGDIASATAEAVAAAEVEAFSTENRS